MISACVITKNEANTIERWLVDMQSIADEIIVVDTGSTDNTVKIAKASNVKVYHYKWKNDFAAAKNFAIEQASGDWILFLDADEFFSEETRGNLRDLLSVIADDSIEALLCKVINIDIDLQNKIIDEFPLSRIFRNRQEIRYVGAVHEKIYNINTKSIHALDMTNLVKIYHTGYSTSIIESKLKRNLVMLQAEIVKNGEEPYYVYLCDCYHGLKDYQKTLEYIHKYFKSGYQIIGSEEKLHWYLIHSMIQLNMNQNVILQEAEKAVRKFPDNTQFKLYYGEVLYNLKEYEKALQYLFESVEKIESKTEQARFAKIVLECLLKLNDKRAIHYSGQLFDAQIDVPQNLKSQVRKMQCDWQEEIAEKRKHKSMKISACVIVKNEEKVIGRWLDCMEKIAHEIIVVDTGSTDKTIEIVKNRNHKVYHYLWENDFSKAKNYAIAQATGDWILFLDADEYFTEACLKTVPIHIEKQHRNKNIDAIVCRLYNIDSDCKGRIISTFSNLRIFRNMPYLRYHGNVHEMLKNDSRNLNLCMMEKEIQIYHTGYSSSILKGKLERNLKLLQDDITKNGDKPDLYHYFCDCYHGLGNFEETIRYARLHLASGCRLISGNVEIYKKMIDAYIALQKSKEEILAVIDEAIEVYPEEPTFTYCKGEIYLQDRKYEKADFYLNQALVFAKKPRDAHSMDIFISYEKYLYICLGKLMLMKNHKDKAIGYFIDALQKGKYDKELFLLFYQNLSALEAADTIACVNTIYDVDIYDDLYFIMDALQYAKPSKVYLYYARLARQKKIVWHHNDVYRDYLALEQYKQAIFALDTELENIYMDMSLVGYLLNNEQVQNSIQEIIPDGYDLKRQKSKGNKKRSEAIENEIFRRSTALGQTIQRIPEGETIMNDRKIALITCVNDEAMYGEAFSYLQKLIVPEGFEMECLAVREADSMASGYNEAMHSSDAKYKIYLQENTFITNIHLLEEVVSLFQGNRNIGLVGLIGARNLGEDCVWWHARETYGRMYDVNADGSIVEKNYGSIQAPYEIVDVIDGAMMATQYDVEWREDVCKEWNFYDISQSYEFRLKNYQVVIPAQQEAWILNIREEQALMQSAEKYRMLLHRVYGTKAEDGTNLKSVTSIVILTYNKLDYTKLCIDSIRTYTKAGSYEIIIVDNASTDGTVEWLKSQPDIRCILNTENLGFPKGCNQGMEIAKGTEILLLNNDTIVTKDWLTNLKKALYSDEKIGAVGPVTNCSVNYQDIEVGYKNVDEMQMFAANYNHTNARQWEEKVKLIGFCILFKRSVLDCIGFLDEQFSPGNYEDDDYCFRMITAGYKILLCNDTFIHHFGNTSFVYNEAYGELLRRNEKKFVQKWGFNAGYSAGIRTDLIELMDKENKPCRILEVGCGCGTTLLRIRYMNPQAEIYGVELCQGSAKIAEKLMPVLAENIETMELKFPENYFDYIIFGDVLEHLQNPWQVLEKMKCYLKDDGYFLASIPNIAHYSILHDLLNGRWQYQEAGILDKTHLRFFTWQTIIDMFQGAGYKIVDKRFKRIGVSDAARKSHEDFVNSIVKSYPMVNREEIMAYQYLVKASKA